MLDQIVDEFKALLPWASCRPPRLSDTAYSPSRNALSIERLCSVYSRRESAQYSWDTMAAPKLNKLADELRPRLMRIVVAMRREMRNSPVPPAQSAVLSALLIRGPMRVSDLAKNEGVRLPTMTQIIGRMVDARLVSRSAPVGSYNNMIQITQEGRSVAADLAEQRTASLSRRMKTLTDQELQTVQAMCAVIDKMFEREPWVDSEHS